MERLWSYKNYKGTNYSYMKYIRRKQDIKLKQTKIKSELKMNEIRSLDLASEKGIIKLVERYDIEMVLFSPNKNRGSC